MILVTINRNELTHLIQWGHWFVFFNIIISLMIGSQYLFIANWPSTLLGRIYSIANCVGQFSFLVFLAYLILLFPLTFILRSYRVLPFIGAIIASIGQLLLLFDLLVFSHFQLHLNLSLSPLLISQDARLLTSEALIGIITIVFISEIILAQTVEKKLRSLQKRKAYIVRPALMLFISGFLFSHVAHIWADANFYRPITMQRTVLPLAYPMTARHLLEKYGLINEVEYQHRMLVEGNPFSNQIQYPLQALDYSTGSNNKSILLITVDHLSNEQISNDMPYLSQWRSQNIQFLHHYSTSLHNEIANFSLFYGLNPNYYDAIIGGHKNSMLLEALNYRKYQMAFINTNSSGMSSPYQKMFLSDYGHIFYANKNNEIKTHWIKWLMTIDRQRPWFAQLDFSLEKSKPKQLDKIIFDIIENLKQIDSLDNTIVIITAYQNTLKKHNDNMEMEWIKQNFQVPLIISWPKKEPQSVDYQTNHTDIVPTLLHDVLGVKNVPRYYSQGRNLFEVQNKATHLTTGNRNKLVVFIPNGKMVSFDPKGRYFIVDDEGKKQKDKQLNMALFLQLLTESRYFIIK